RHKGDRGEWRIPECVVEICDSTIKQFMLYRAHRIVVVECRSAAVQQQTTGGVECNVIAPDRHTRAVQWGRSVEYDVAPGNHVEPDQHARVRSRALVCQQARNAPQGSVDCPRVRISRMTAGAVVTMPR